ncbi:uncharacterized protein LOC122032201 [Zingiber officinale]|uniref:Small ribosomal subunit protein mS35 mitochondrial conserved domain-containing protein n=1 Tax=Zingiber officinale TaxID=94328 RepID=A0A8J5EUL5_ZINOF|nr:uncharacterized protein LOC122032201 [Zingiber officinale]KAG6470759.1 hypothetical protein ZIOFF_071836 [Zingiber officinale]
MRRHLIHHSHLLVSRLRPPPPRTTFTSSAQVPSLNAFLRPFSSSSDSEVATPPVPAASVAEALKGDPLVEDVSNKELKRRLELYYKDDSEEALQSVMEAILKRRLSRKHEETDDELIEELRMTPLTDVKDQEFESDFEEMHTTDEEIDNLYNAREHVEKKLMKNKHFNVNDQKWDDFVRDATEKGFLKDTKECEDILEDMVDYRKLLPDEVKQKVEAKFNELGEMCERGESPTDEYSLFEDKIVAECMEKMEEEPPEEDKKVKSDDPPGEGPILRWQSRVVFGPGGDAWHPKNRKVKLSVTVKELGLSRYAFRRLCEVVGKRYHSGKDELTITSERFEHREENRKDCLRTLLALIEDAEAADELVEKARHAYAKDRLKANPHFMQRLKAKTAKLQLAAPA